MRGAKDRKLSYWTEGPNSGSQNTEWKLNLDSNLDYRTDWNTVAAIWNTTNAAYPDRLDIEDSKESMDFILNSQQ